MEETRPTPQPVEFVPLLSIAVAIASLVTGAGSLVVGDGLGLLFVGGLILASLGWTLAAAGLALCLRDRRPKGAAVAGLVLNSILPAWALAGLPLA